MITYYRLCISLKEEDVTHDCSLSLSLTDMMRFFIRIPSLDILNKRSYIPLVFIIIVITNYHPHRLSYIL